MNSQEEIKSRAYWLWEAQGFRAHSAADDWALAEEQLSIERKRLRSFLTAATRRCVTFWPRNISWQNSATWNFSPFRGRDGRIVVGADGMVILHKNNRRDDMSHIINVAIAIGSLRVVGTDSGLRSLAVGVCVYLALDMLISYFSTTVFGFRTKAQSPEAIDVLRAQRRLVLTSIDLLVVIPSYAVLAIAISIVDPSQWGRSAPLQPEEGFRAAIATITTLGNGINPAGWASDLWTLSLFGTGMLMLTGVLSTIGQFLKRGTDALPDSRVATSMHHAMDDRRTLRQYRRLRWSTYVSAAGIIVAASAVYCWLVISTISLGHPSCSCVHGCGADNNQGRDDVDHPRPDRDQNGSDVTPCGPGVDRRDSDVDQRRADRHRHSSGSP